MITSSFRVEISVCKYCPEMWMVRLHGLNPTQIIKALNGVPLPGYNFWDESLNEEGHLELEPKSWDTPSIITTEDGVLAVCGYYEYENEDRLDGTIPMPTEMNISQIMDVAHITKKLLALAA